MLWIFFCPVVAHCYTSIVSGSRERLFTCIYTRLECVQHVSVTMVVRYCALDLNDLQYNSLSSTFIKRWILYTTYSVWIFIVRISFRFFMVKTFVFRQLPIFLKSFFNDYPQNDSSLTSTYINKNIDERYILRACPNMFVKFYQVFIN